MGLIFGKLYQSRFVHFPQTNFALLILISAILFHICQNFTDVFKVRLTGGANNSEGRLEVMYEGSWGTVCDNGWDLNDATVVCRMLGFDGALAATLSAQFGQGHGKILLDDVQCQGTENNLADCYHRGITVHNCNHASDSGAICFSGGTIHSYST